MALLAASAVMAETIPPCINLIILGFVANLSIGGLFMAGLLPAGLMALALMRRRDLRHAAALARPMPARTSLALWGGGVVALGLIVIIFGGVQVRHRHRDRNLRLRRVYALVGGAVVLRELGLRAALPVSCMRLRARGSCCSSSRRPSRWPSC